MGGIRDHSPWGTTPSSTHLSVIAQVFAPSPREPEAARPVPDAASFTATADGAITTADGRVGSHQTFVPLAVVGAARATR